MALSYQHPEGKLPHWAKVHRHFDIAADVSHVAFDVICVDGTVRIKTSMPDSLWGSGQTKREVIENMIEQLTVQLATLTLEEK